MKRSGPPARNTPLRRTEFKRRLTQNPPARARGRGQRDSVEFSEQTKRKVRIRANDRCEVGLPGCTVYIDQFHHRRMRAAGGKGTFLNALAVCARCHHHIHHNVRWSYHHGMLVRGHRQPVDVPVHAGCTLNCRAEHVVQ